MSDSPAAILYDNSGNPVGVVLDSTLYRLQVEAKLATGHGLATETTLASIKDTDGIKKITDALPAGDNNIGNVDLASSIPAGDNNIGNVDLASSIPAGTAEIGKVAQGTKALAADAWPFVLYDSSGNPVGVTLDGSIYRLQVLTKVANAAGTQINPATQETLASIKDTDGVKKITDSLPAGTNVLGRAILSDGSVDLAVVNDTAIPANTRRLLVAGQDEDGYTQTIEVIEDPVDGKHRLQIEGKVSISAPTPPANTTPVTVAADTPLAISTDTTTDYTITSGKTFVIQQITAGAEGDPTEKGSVIEIYYVDSSSVEHLVERIYVTGFTQSGIYPDTSEARDGTPMTGNGTTTKVRIIRKRLSGSSQQVESVVRGYEVTT